MQISLKSTRPTENLDLFDLVESKLDARFAAENRHKATQAALVVKDFFDATVEVLERTFLDANNFAGFEHAAVTVFLDLLNRQKHFAE